MARGPELSARTVIWTFIAASEAVAYVLTYSTDVPIAVRYYSGWYTLVVGVLLLAAAAITLSVLFGEYGRLDSAQGYLMRLFLFL